MVQIRILSPEALDTAASALLEMAGPRRKVALLGEMGAGKTTFTATFCRLLGVAHETASPTFSLINTYHYSDAAGASATVYHLDLYRLQRPEEAFDIGLEELLYNDAWCLVEWPHIIADYLPPDTLWIEIKTADQKNERLFTIYDQRPDTV